MLQSYWAPSALLCFQLVRVLRNWDLLSGVKVRYAVVVQIVELYFNFQCLLYHSHIFLPVCFCCCSRDDEQIGSETPSQGRLSQMPDVGASDGRRPGANLMELMNKVHKGGLTNEEAPPHHSITYFSLLGWTC